MTAFDLPIPGQSLTSTPKGAPYERPPEIVELQDVVKLHMENLNNEQAVQDIVHFCKMGIDVKTLTEGILRSAVVEGMHSIDNSINCAPILHERIIGILNAANVDYEEGFENFREQRALQVSRRIADLQKGMRDIESSPLRDEEVDLAMLAEDTPEDIIEEIPEETQQDESVETEGLMSRRT